VSRELVAAVTDAGGEIYVWTVDEIQKLRELEAMGVTGVITNDPRLFTKLAA
jgi:glycerophosphoryl diester phosphodiesterase